jgi:hypothetical protein
MSLANELKLLIINCLDTEGDLPNQKESELEIAPEEGSLGDPSLRRPTANRAVLNLSCVNRSLRNITAPILFKTVILRNTEASARSLQTLAVGPYAHLVKQVEYLAVVDRPQVLPSFAPAEEERLQHGQPARRRRRSCWVGGCFGDEVEERPATRRQEPHRRTFIEQGNYGDRTITLHAPMAKDFPVEVEDVLANLARFGSLEMVGVDFCWDHEDHWLDDFFNAWVPETDRQILEAERKDAWRALMAVSYTALTKNPVGVVKKLVLRNVVSRETSAWRLDGWRELLGGLDTFEISLRGGNNGSGWCLCIMPLYEGFLRTIPELLLRHLSEARSVRLFATHEGPMGVDEFFWTRLNSMPTWMPTLQHLSLSFLFLHDGLVRFLTSRAHTLRSLRFYNLYATRIYQLPNGERGWWKDFFRALLHAKPMFAELCEFEMDWERNYGTMGSRVDERAQLEFKLPYALLNDTRGVRFIGSTDVEPFGGVQAPDLENDLNAYQEFQNFVERNREGKEDA